MNNHSDITKARRLYVFDCLAVAALASAVLVAFIPQFFLHELPCPLCLLQRWGMMAMACGLLANITIQVSARHYGMTILASLFTFLTSMRQVLLHIMPGDPGYGDPLFGVHLYSWVSLMSIAMILYCALVVTLGSEENVSLAAISPGYRRLGKLVYAIVVLALCTNTLSAFIECGPHACPDNPTSYWLIDKLTNMSR